MSKIVRKVMKIFGQNAGGSQLAQFGSLAAGAPAFSTDPATIQSLGNYLTGWFAAVVGGNSPAIEDMNALNYLFAYQLAYLMQTGTPEWETGTTYFAGSRVNDGAGNVRVSRTDNNVGNALTDTTNWRETYGLMPIGSVVATFPNLTGAYTTTATTVADANGFVKCNGQTLADATSAMNGVVIPNINNSVFIQGNTTAGTTGGSTTAAHTHGINHAHQWSYQSGAGSLYTLIAANTAVTTYTTSAPAAVLLSNSNFTAGGVAAANYFGQNNTAMWTSGIAANDNSGGTGTGAQSGSTSPSIIPPFISAVYLMRVK